MSGHVSMLGLQVLQLLERHSNSTSAFLHVVSLESREQIDDCTEMPYPFTNREPHIAFIHEVIRV
jgi:hypothetical protein